MSETFRARTLAGVSWSAITQLVNQGFTFAISVILARLLGPKVYGLIGMVAVFTGFAAVFGDLGLGAAIIQRKELEQRHLNAAFWANLTVGIAMTLVMTALAPVVAWFYKEPLLIALTSATALRYVLDSVNVVQLALINRAMHFQRLAVIQIGSTVISGLLGLGLALSGAGPWSLVAQTLGASVIALALSWRLAGWRPDFSFERTACQQLFGFSAYVLGFSIVNYWARSLDQLMIGRFIGPAALGIYSRANSLMLMPLNQVSRVLGQVMFPALSSIQDDKPRVKRAYLKAISFIGLITFPMMAGAFAVSEHLILALLGDKWAGVIPVFKILCWVGLLQSIWTTVGWIYTSQGRTALYFTMGVIGSVAYAIAFIIGIRWGVIGVAWAYAICSFLLWYPFWVVAGHLVELSFSEMMRCLSPALCCALAMGAAVWCAGRLFASELEHWHCLAVQIPLGIAFYILLVAGLRLDSWREARQAASQLLVGRFKSLRLLLWNSA